MRLQPLFEVSGIIWFLAFVFLAWGALLLWQWLSTRALAPKVFAAKRDQGELKPHVDEATFNRAFLAAEAPRRSTYFFASAFVCALALPPLMSVFSRAWYEIWTLSGRFEPAANGTLVYTFCLFLFSMAVMIAVLYITMRRYYSTPQTDLREAIRDLNGASR